MFGIRIFDSLTEAEAAGFRFHDRTPDGMIVRREDGRLMAFALVRAPRDDRRQA
jgi:hypothetical protein